MRRQQILLTLAFALTIPAIAGAFSLKDFEVAAADQGHPEAGQRFNIARGKRLVVGTKCDQLAGDPDDPQKIGPGVPIDQVDSAAAIEACKQAVDVSPLARYQYQLGRVLLTNKAKLTEALHWHRKAADQGYGVAQQYLGFFYEVGLGLGGGAPDHAEAMKWYRKAADHGSAFAQAAIGLAYEEGKDVPQDYAEAMKWHRKAADQGYKEAQYFIGKMYINGQGVSKDYAEAMTWYLKAADQGLPEAQTAVGVMYSQGKVVAQDYAEAMKWYRKAADQGHAGAQGLIGIAYYQGKGVPQDYAEAMKWLRLSAAQGEKGAIAFLYSIGAEPNASEKPIVTTPKSGWVSIYSDNGHEESYDADSLQVDKQGQGSVWMKISLSDEDRVGYGKLAEMKGDADGVAKAKQTAVRKQKAVVRCDNPFVTYTITEVYDLSGELITTYNDPDHPTVMSVGPGSTEEALYQLICGT